jgi:Spy/CpxP family protein refolding chaperone
MKKIIILTAVAAFLLSTVSVNAQDRNDRDSRRQEMQARQTERIVKDLKLEGEKKTQFEAIYKRYMEELAATRTGQNRERDDEKKDLTDEEATAKLNEVFARQAEQIQQQQLRLDIQKKYCAELSAILTPQQLLQVFQQQGGGRQGGGRQGGRQGNRGGFGGGPRGGFGGPGGGPGGDF